MMNTKNMLKELGGLLRSSGSGHRSLLRAKLAARAEQTTVPSGWGIWPQFMFVGTGAVALVAVIIAARPIPPSVVYDASVPEEGAAFYEDAPGEASYGQSDDVEWAFEPLMFAVEDRYDVIDYKNEHGSMLAKTTRVNLLTTKEGVASDVEKLFSSIGGHVTEISTYDITQPVVITGLVPTDSYFLFRDQLREMVSADRFLSETLNATDLILSAMSLDEQIAEKIEEIDALKKQISEAKDQNHKAGLEYQLKNRETHLEYLQESREDLDNRVAYTTVTVSVDEIPGFWEARERYDLQRLVAGFDIPSYFQQMWINVLTTCFWALHAFSLTFWFIIPLVIWLVVRKRAHQAWAELE